jgi:tRNA threonylcarbamoyladenosine modification (KEOPS) complex Cgi121 subunit
MYVGIAGARSVQVETVESVVNLVRERLGDVTVQLFDATYVAGWQHLFFAALNALKAFRNGTNISNSLAVECLLYASAQTQIRVALDVMGIKETSSEVAILVVGSEAGSVKRSLMETLKLLHGVLVDDVLDLSDKKLKSVKRLFAISDEEVGAMSEKAGQKAAISDLVIEHMALLATSR